MAKRYFDAERDYMASLVPEFYEDADTRDISPRYRTLWNVLCGRAIRTVFGTTQVPKTATEEQLQEVKRILREEIVKKTTRFRPSVGEETEPAE